MVLSTPVKQPHLHVGDKCPHCGLGMIFPAWRAKVCICCGLRSDDVVSKEDLASDVTLFWLIRNKPSESCADPLERRIYIGKK